MHAQLNRRSHNYSSRKPLIYAGKYQSQNKRLVLLPYGDELKKQRAAFHRMLQPRGNWSLSRLYALTWFYRLTLVVGSYENMQEMESAKLLLDTLNLPGDMEMNMKRYAASVVFTLAYGRRLDEDDKELLAVLDILDGFIRDCYPGAHLVDTFPVMDLLPDIFSPWRASARKKHEIEMQVFNRKPFLVIFL